MIRALLLILGVCLLSGCDADVDHTLPSPAGVQLSAAIRSLDYNNLKQAQADLDRARRLDPNHPAIRPIEARIKRELGALDLLQQINRDRSEGKLREAQAKLDQIPRDIPNYYRNIDHHSDLSRLLPLFEQIEARTGTETAQRVLARFGERVRHYPDELKLVGPRQAPAVRVAPGRFLIGACVEEQPCPAEGECPGQVLCQGETCHLEEQCAEGETAPCPQRSVCVRREGMCAPEIPCKRANLISGVSDSMIDRARELPQHAMSFEAAFYIDLMEVSAADYAACIEAKACSLDGVTASDVKDPQGCSLNAPGRERYPVNCVSYPAARRYCDWVGGRVPSEFEWEAAARGDNGRRFPWGEIPAGCRDGLARFDGHGCEHDRPAETGQHPAGMNSRGMLDVAGNVAEWTASLMDPMNREGELLTRPLVIRGGGFTDPLTELRTTARVGRSPETHAATIGFRCVYDD